MKKVTVLFSAIALTAALAGIYAAKSNVDDIVYICNTQVGICDIITNGTFVPHGDPIMFTEVTFTPGGHCGTSECPRQFIYPRI